jgi:glycosyltransferase involved in cell wall biosynthesis
MNLLVISNNPSRASYRQRIGIYLDMLRANGAACELAALPRGSLARWRLFKRAADFDGVVLHKKCLNSVDAVALRKSSRRIIYDFDDAVMYDDKLPDRRSPKRQRSFERTVKLADLVIAGNSYLAGLARAFNSNVEVLATGLDTGAYDTQAGSGSDGLVRLVWVGSKSTLRYLKRLEPVLEEVRTSCPNVVLRIVCDDFMVLNSMPVEKREWSLEDQVADLVSSDIGLAPLPDNRFTQGKCAFKVLQYFAAGLPVVASPTGTNSRYVTDGVTGYLAEKNEQLAAKIAALVRDPALRTSMGQVAKSWVRQFDAEIIGRRLCGLVRNCLEGGRQTPGV